MNKILASFIFALIAGQLQAQAVSEIPKLVVGITVDQLRTDYLQMMQHLFGEKGFKRLMKEGVMYDNVIFDYPQNDGATSVATIHTGTTPDYHGIVNNSVYNRNLERIESSLLDLDQLGNYTAETLSPRNLLTSTISDELKTATDGLSTVYSIAPWSWQAILAGGHNANAAFWLNEVNGKWATSTYYKDIPWYVEQFNMAASPAARIDTMAWVPLYPITKYDGLPYYAQDFLFKYQFAKGKNEKYAWLKSSGLVNQEVNQLVQTFFQYADLGTRKFPDVLNIGYSAANYRGKAVQDLSLELQDTYVRLDKDLAGLLDMIDKKVGLNNAFIYLTSTGYFDADGAPSPQFGIPGGEFFPKRSLSLLNMYLMAIYGQGDWVKAFHNNQIYLNRKLISEKTLDLKEIQEKAAEFVVQMAGVKDVTTSHQMLHGNWNNGVDKERRGYHRKLSGDLIVEFQPGWTIVFENVADTRTYVQSSAIPSPLFFFGKNIKPQQVSRPVKATEIAPTVSRILRIRSPNASKELALPEIK